MATLLTVIFAVLCIPTSNACGHVPVNSTRVVISQDDCSVVDSSWTVVSSRANGLILPGHAICPNVGSYSSCCYSTMSDDYAIKSFNIENYNNLEFGVNVRVEYIANIYFSYDSNAFTLLDTLQAAQQNDIFEQFNDLKYSIPDPTTCPANILNIKFQTVADADDITFDDLILYGSSIPTTYSPTTASPTYSPTTASPTTSSPTTYSPTTSSPTTYSPTTALPTTTSPTTSSPTTYSPTTALPTTTSPTTYSPTTSSPTTYSPTTYSPITALPTTALPTTYSPTTSLPTAIATYSADSEEPDEENEFNRTQNADSSTIIIVLIIIIIVMFICFGGYILYLKKKKRKEFKMRSQKEGHIEMNMYNASNEGINHQNNENEENTATINQIKNNKYNDDVDVVEIINETNIKR